MRELDKFMSLMANPMVILTNFQQALNSGPSIDPRKLNEGYLSLYDEPNVGRKRYSFIKVVDGEVQVLAIFGLEDPINGVECYSVGYAVNEKYRGRGLAVEAVNKGLAGLVKVLNQRNIDSFLMEAVIDKTNTPSIKVAEKLFSAPGVPVMETESETPSWHFRRLITLR